MAILGMTNSRLKDFYDLHELAMHRDFDGAILAAAIRSTSERRHTSIRPARFLGPILEKLGSRSSFSGKWLAGGPWRSRGNASPGAI
jgi:hypothetical protein